MNASGDDSLRSSETAQGPALHPLRETSVYHPVAVYRCGDTVVKETGPWAASVHALLGHLQDNGFQGAPRVVGTGFDAQGREILTYIEGEFTHPGPWSLEGAAAVGTLLRQLHDVTASFHPPRDAVWFPWFGRALGEGARVIGHGDVAPWNIVARQGRPVALIDWERAGPVDPRVELAQACWLNAKLHDDLVAELEGLPPLRERARQLRAMVDAYGLSAAQRRGFVELMIEFVVHDTANEADEARIGPEGGAATPKLLWGLAWRARAAAWLCRHRRVLENALS
ncbi:phosphotransferase [Deinococcus aestuarii]|uniref:phosphotransferase n=1 Tax=Deinococcus aestuarii TaxID=2774531 RepID=UPI001C0BCF37